MKVLVTGHQGYIGSVMVPMLQRAGHSVTGYDSDLYQRCTYAPGGPQASVPSIRKDVRDVHARDLEGFDAVIHLAALSNDPLGNLDPELTYEINHKASVRFARAAKDAGVSRFLLASSCSNYGLAGDDIVDETGELKPGDCLRVVQGAFGTRHFRTGGYQLLADLPPPGDRLRLVAAAALRHRPQQPCRLGGDAGCHHAQVRRKPVAADRSHRGHLARLHRRPRGTSRKHPQRSVQRRPDASQLPHPRHRRDRRGRGSGLQAGVRCRRRT